MNGFLSIDRLLAENMPLSSLNRLFFGRLACYDIRRNRTPLSVIVQKHYPGIPLNRLRFFLYYGGLGAPIGLHIAPFPENPNDFLKRFARYAENDTSGPCLVQVLYYGRTPEYANFFYFLAPQSFFRGPKLLDRFKNAAAETMKVDFRSKVAYWLDTKDPDSTSMEIDRFEDADEVGTVLRYIRMEKANSEDPADFPSTFKYTWKDIEDATLKCRRWQGWPFEGEGISLSVR